MNVLKALLLTLAPPVIGLSSSYLSIGDYTPKELLTIIGNQLLFHDYRWLAVSLLFNLWLVWKLEARPKALVCVCVVEPES